MTPQCHLGLPRTARDLALFDQTAPVSPANILQHPVICHPSKTPAPQRQARANSHSVRRTSRQAYFCLSSFRLDLSPSLPRSIPSQLTGTRLALVSAVVQERRRGAREVQEERCASFATLHHPLVAVWLLSNAGPASGTNQCPTFAEAAQFPTTFGGRPRRTSFSPFL